MVRIGGLASGMDIDSLVKDLMKAERMPLDKLKQKKQVLEWQRDDYRAMNTLLLDFRSELTQMKLTTKYRARTTASTNEARVTATASSAAAQASYSISKVEQLATAETRVNAGSIFKSGSQFDETKGLYSQDSKFEKQKAEVWKTGALQTETISVTASGREFKISGTTGNIKADELTNWSVKVNGVGFNAITEAELGTGTLTENQVLVKADGSLQFGKDIAKDSSIRVEYVTDKKTETLSIGSSTNSLRLAQGTIDQVTLKLVTDGKAQDLTIDTNGRITNSSNVEVGVLNKETGEIIFNSQMPRPAKDSKTKISLEVQYDHKYTSFSVGAHTSKGERHESFLISGSESLNSVVNEVNSSSAGVNMFFDKQTGKMSLTRTETGDFNSNGDEISTSGDFIQTVLRLGTDTSVGAKVEVQAANAKFVINGLETNRSSNTFEMNGVTFTLKQTFTDNQPVSVSINNDSSKVFDNIKEFVTKYNEMIDKIQKKTSEEKYRSYTPLTDDQREQLSDKQQEMWEEKAKSGLLRRDPLLASVLSNMRMDFSQPVGNDQVSGMFNQLAKLGITTTANYLEGGKLEINEAKLKKAIEEDPESVENFFRGDGTTDGQKGVIQRLYDTVSRTMDQLKEKAGNSFSTQQQFAIGRTLKGLDSRIDSFENRLTQIEDRYWRQFTAMEKAIQRSNSQSTFLMNQFSS
ncbi:flagellar filament capping protein FliD [Pseudobacillus sp. 179-B 2D1 NHS]|uniref:flagellar filament capping protein FliD n=1 Tax=Pseudobacillus sp. 179-B 2D1 NHS TaxID=3374292 RepID=UPI003879CB8B